jgi:hypothetical protein
MFFEDLVDDRPSRLNRILAREERSISCHARL